MKIFVIENADKPERMELLKIHPGKPSSLIP